MEILDGAVAAMAASASDDAYLDDTYRAFLEAKVPVAPPQGLPCDLADINPILLPHQAAIVQWAVRGGRRALFEAFGLGKTIQQLEIVRLVCEATAGLGLIVAPLGVRREFMRDAEMLGIRIAFVQSDAEIDGNLADDPQDMPIFLTNYESVRDGKIDVSRFEVVSLDEASVLRSFGSKTYQTFLPLFEGVPYRFVATATPSPNRYKELIHYAGYLGIMDTGQALTRFFQRNSEKAGDLTPYPHKIGEFYAWLNSFAIFLQHPSDLCRCPCHGELPSPVSDLEISELLNGSLAQAETAHGAASAIAGASASRHPAICAGATSEVADAGAHDTAERDRAASQSGRPCSHDAETQIIRTGPTTAAEESASASAGSTIETSSQIWGNPEPTIPSSASTTTPATGPETASGQAEKHNPETPGDLSSSNIKGDHNPLQPGRKSLAAIIGNSTAASNQDGPSKGYSRTSCPNCRCHEYSLPPIDIRYHEVKADLADGGTDKNGQVRLMRESAMGVTAAAREKRATLSARVGKATEIVRGAGEDHFILWHDLEDERRAIEASLPEAESVYGAQPLDKREGIIGRFAEGMTRLLAAKPVMLGSGTNLQRHCHRAIFTGIGFKFNDLIQAIHRLQRFQQPHPVVIDIIYAETEKEILRDLQAKWARHDELTARMSELIRRYGLNHEAAAAEQLSRSIGVERKVETGDGWTLAYNDCVDEARRLAEGSVDLVVTSIPFSNHYEYTPSYNDFGHTDDDAHFFAQMDYLTPKLLRALAPGRLACIHVKDRILFGSVTGEGVPTVNPFHAKCIDHYIRHGFQFMGMITVVTDVVRENNQTYRLSYSEMLKDGTKMGVGSPEYVLLMRKPQTDRTKGYADNRVNKVTEVTLRDGRRFTIDHPEFEEALNGAFGAIDEVASSSYSLARWQVDAHALWRSSGNRPLTDDELWQAADAFAEMPIGGLIKDFTKRTRGMLYNHRAHYAIGEAIEARDPNDERGHLPRTYASLAPGSHHPDVWDDVVRMRTLNTEQVQKGREKHVCPLQFDIVDRLVERYSMPGELVFDPFCGLGTVPLRALKLGRRGAGSELNGDYWAHSVAYLREAEQERGVPSLFDLLGAAA